MGVGPPVRCYAAYCQIYFALVVVIVITPPPVGGQCFVFARFLCLRVSLSAIIRENGRTDLHEIFREGVDCGVTMG